MGAMTLTLGPTTFDLVAYDAAADVLHLHVGPPERAVECHETDEGHAVRFDAERSLVGLTIVNARGLVGRAEPVVITFPVRMLLDGAPLADAVGSR